MKRSLLYAPLLAAFCTLPAHALDTTGALVCDLSEAAQCDAAASCEGVSPDQIGLPPVFVIDFEAKLLSSEDGARTSPVTAVEEHEASVLLQGHQHGRAWSISLDRASGHLSATAVDPEGAFVLAGACTAR